LGIRVKSSYFILVLIIPLIGITAMMPSAFAAEVSVPAGTGTPGCEETNECWIPAEVTVDVGGEVIWSNDDTAAHTVTHGVPGTNYGAFDSSLFMAGTTFSVTFNEAGTFPYYCMVHPWMIGVVVVEAEAPSVDMWDARVTDMFGNTITEATVGDSVGVTVNIANGANRFQEFVYYVKVRETGIDGWLSGELSPGEVVNPSLSMKLEKAGTFTADVYVFDNMQNQNKLTGGLTTQITVKGISGPAPDPVSTKTVRIPSGTGTPGCEESYSCFTPYSISIRTGDLVTWFNDDSAAHTVTSGRTQDAEHGILFDSSLFMSRATFTHQFNQAGEYPYFCMVHPWMLGIVNVEGSPVVAAPIVRDITPPKILQPTDITVDATDNRGAVVHYEVLAIDDIDEIVRPSCRPFSGSSFPIGETTVTCSATDFAGNSARQVSFTIMVNEPPFFIPAWIKEVAAFWCDDKIDDTAFIDGIQYLIDNDIIIVEATSSGTGGSQEVPAWVKNNACWWSLGSITDEDFASGLEYLIGQGIIRV